MGCQHHGARCVNFRAAPPAPHLLGDAREATRSLPSAWRPALLSSRKINDRTLRLVAVAFDKLGADKLGAYRDSARKPLRRPFGETR